MTFHPDSLPDLTGKVYIVTGTTSGIGYGTAARLAQHNAHVYVCARSEEKGTATVTRIKSQYLNARLSVLKMNHLSLADVVAAAKHFLERETVLHGLINNAGIMATPYEITTDGYEAQWQTNYLAHWVFTSHLLPMLLRTSKDPKLSPGSVRIVNLSSSGHYSAPKTGINFADISLKGEKSMARYGQSKLANVLHTKTLHKLYGPGSASANSGNGEIWTSTVHPGLVKSNLTTNSDLPAWLALVAIPYRWIGGEVDEDVGGWTSVFCAASKDMKREHSGAYFQRIADPNGWQSRMARDAGLAERLEKWTREEMVKGDWVDGGKN